jgi:hypothetical protein
MLHEILELFYGVITVWDTGNKAHGEVKPKRGGHGAGNRIKIDGFALSRHGPGKDSLRQGASQPGSAAPGSNPQPLQFPGIFRELARGSAPSNKSGRLPIHQPDHRAATLLVKALRQSGGFLFKRPKAEPRRGRLADDKPPVFEQKLTRLRHYLNWRSHGQLHQLDTTKLVVDGSHGPSLRWTRGPRP